MRRRDWIFYDSNANTISCSVRCKYSTNRTYLFVVCDFNDIVSYAVLWPPLQEVTFLCAEIEWKLTENLIGVQRVSKKTRNVTNQINQGHGGQLYSKIVPASAPTTEEKQKGVGRCVYVPVHVRCMCVWVMCMHVCDSGWANKKKNCRREQSSGHIHSFLVM